MKCVTQPLGSLTRQTSLLMGKCSSIGAIWCKNVFQRLSYQRATLMTSILRINTSVSILNAEPNLEDTASRCKRTNLRVENVVCVSAYSRRSNRAAGKDTAGRHTRKKECVFPLHFRKVPIRENGR